MTGQKLYPLKLHPVLKEKIWGGRNLANLLGKNLPPGALIGESWEVADEAVIDNGAYRGATLASLVSNLGMALTGRLAWPCDGNFPLLVKFIDAHDRLSVQVHPDDAAAHASGFSRGKTEAWLVLAASSGAEIIHGFRRSPPPATELTALALDGRLSATLQSVAVAEGDVVFIPAGTVHAIGAGICICEVQQNSDITYRLYDWDRRCADGLPRELHVTQAAEVSHHSPAVHKISPVVISDSYGMRSVLVACRYFAMEMLELDAPLTQAGDGRSFRALCCLRGEGRVIWDDGYIDVALGECLVVPASLGDYSLVPSGNWRLLATYVPDLAYDVIGPLRAADVTDEAILRLGGDVATNDLLDLIKR